MDTWSRTCRRPAASGRGTAGHTRHRTWPNHAADPVTDNSPGRGATVASRKLQLPHGRSEARLTNTHAHSDPASRTHAGHPASTSRARAGSVALACATPHVLPDPKAPPVARSWALRRPKARRLSSQADGPPPRDAPGAAVRATHVRRRCSPCVLVSAEGRDRSARPGAWLGPQGKGGAGPVCDLAWWAASPLPIGGSWPPTP